MSQELIDQKNQAYAERNKILSAFAWTLYRRQLKNCLGIVIGLAKHPENDKDWEHDWRNILVIETPEGQMTWHFHDSEMYLFRYFPPFPNYKWDGHTTEQKYERLLKYFV